MRNKGTITEFIQAKLKDRESCSALKNDNCGKDRSNSESRVSNEARLTFQVELERLGPSARPAPDAKAIDTYGLADLISRGFISAHADATPYFASQKLLPLPAYSSSHRTTVSPSEPNAEGDRYPAHVDLSARCNEKVNAESLKVPSSRANTPSNETSPQSSLSLVTLERHYRTTFILFGHMQRQLKSFTAFKQRNVQWDARIEYWIGELEYLCRMHAVAFAEVSLDALGYLAIDQSSPVCRPSALKSCFVSGTFAEFGGSVKEATWVSGSRGRAVSIAATRIQALWRMYRQRKDFTTTFKRLLAARCIWFHWQAKKRGRLFMQHREEAYKAALPKYEQLSAELRSSWADISANERVVVHLPSLNFGQTCRNLLPDGANEHLQSEFDSWQMSQSGRLLGELNYCSDKQNSKCHIIIVLPRLNSALLHFYDLVLGHAQRQNYSVEYIIPESTTCFQNSFAIPLAKLLLASPKSLLKLRQTISQMQESIRTEKHGAMGGGAVGESRPNFESLQPSSNAFLLPGVVGKEEIRLAAHLGIPILGPSYEFLCRHGSIGSAKELIQTAGLVPSLPYRGGIRSVEELCAAIVGLASEFSQFSDWEIALDEIMALESLQRVAHVSRQSIASVLKLDGCAGNAASSESIVSAVSEALVISGTARIKSRGHLFHLLFKTGTGCVVQPSVVSLDPIEFYKSSPLVSVMCIVEPDSHAKVLGTLEPLYTLDTLGSSHYRSWAHVFPQQQFCSSDLYKLALNFCNTLAVSTKFSGYIELQCCSSRNTCPNSDIAVYGYMPWYTVNMSRLHLFLSSTNSKSHRSTGQYICSVEPCLKSEFHQLQLARHLKFDVVHEHQLSEHEQYLKTQEHQRIGILADGLYHRHMSLVGVSSFLSLTQRARIVWDDREKIGTLVAPTPVYLSQQLTPNDADWSDRHDNNWNTRVRNLGYHTNVKDIHLHQEVDQPQYSFLAVHTDFKTVVTTTIQNLAKVNATLNLPNFSGKSNFDEAVASLLGLLVRVEARDRKQETQLKLDVTSDRNCSSRSSLSDDSRTPPRDNSNLSSCDSLGGEKTEISVDRRTRTSRQTLTSKKALPAILSPATATSLKKVVIPSLIDSLAATTTASVSSFFEKLVIKYFNRAIQA